MALIEITYQDLNSPLVDSLINLFGNKGEFDYERGVDIDFDIAGRVRKHKLSPIVRTANPSDAFEIVNIYKSVYKGTYPYKEMENVDSVKAMIQSKNHQWFVYMDNRKNIAGCITFVLDFPQKRGYIRGFMLKPRFQGKIDITKAMIISMVCMTKMYKDRIYVWYVENRTAHAKSQYSMSLCGISPIAFFPNKDVFLGEIESDLMQITYDSKAFHQFRSNKIPTLIPEAQGCFQYASLQYHIFIHRIIDKKLTSDRERIRDYRNRIKGSVQKDEFGYEQYRLEIQGTDSYFEFLYTPNVANIEKIKYKNGNPEQLHAYLQVVCDFVKLYGIRYIECVVSAYSFEEQSVFADFGFIPRGYIPCWNYNGKTEEFEDCILFSRYAGKISESIQLIDQGKILCQYLNLEPTIES